MAIVAAFDRASLSHFFRSQQEKWHFKIDPLDGDIDHTHLGELRLVDLWCAKRTKEE